MGRIVFRLCLAVAATVAVGTAAPAGRPQASVAHAAPSPRSAGGELAGVPLALLGFAALGLIGQGSRPRRVESMIVG